MIDHRKNLKKVHIKFISKTVQLKFVPTSKNASANSKGM